MNNPWQVLGSLKILQGYSKEGLEAFADRLFDTADEETFLTDFAFLQDCISTLEAIKARVKPTVTQIVLNQPKTFELAGYKFTYVPQTKYKYENCDLWKQANESVKLNLEYQKQIEDTCKTGGTIDGVAIEKVPVEITDNFRMTKAK